MEKNTCTEGTMMEERVTKEFILPHEVNVLKFVQSRASEIAMATEELQKKLPKLAMQQLPRHLRRRATSHNIKRLPRRLREKAAKEFEAMKVKKTKRPSRRHRRRPKNLLEEYNRRKRKHTWLETHIWFAKRFKMTEMWGYKIGLKPNDKGVRAAYRASACHCLMQDISYYCCIELKGLQENILKGLSQLVHQSTGLTFGAKGFLNGTREGNVMVYSSGSYMYDAICPVRFLWKARANDCQEPRQLWIWCHPAAHDQLTNELLKVFEIEAFKSEAKDDITISESSAENTEEKHIGALQKKDSSTERDAKTPSCDVEHTSVFVGKEITITLLKENLVRFRLTGPLAQTCLGAAVHGANVEVHHSAVDTNAPKWWQSYYQSEAMMSTHTMQTELWNTLKGMQTSVHLPPGIVVPMTVRDPRMTLPRMRTKAIPSASHYFDIAKFESLSSEPSVFQSPIWEAAIRNIVKATKMTESEINKLRYQCNTNGCELEMGAEESFIPIFLLHQPGNSSSDYSSGWDVVIPLGWAMPFWVALIYRGARAAGLQEHRSVALEASQPVFPFNYPDTPAGQKQSNETYAELAAKYHRYPPDKRPSFKKLGIETPFFCPYKELVKEWKQRFSSGDNRDNQEDAKFFVLRNRKQLKLLQRLCEECTIRTHPRKAPRMQQKHVGALDELKELIANEELQLKNSLVLLKLECVSKGRPKAFSSICMPHKNDVQLLKFGFGGPRESKHPVKKERKEKKQGKKRKREEMEQQVPLTKPVVSNLLDGYQREVIGFTEVGEFSFRSARGTALGYCALLGLVKHLEDCTSLNVKPVVLLRAQHSFQYRFAHLSIIV